MVPEQKIGAPHQKSVERVIVRAVVERQRDVERVRGILDERVGFVGAHGRKQKFEAQPEGKQQKKRKAEPVDDGSGNCGGLDVAHEGRKITLHSIGYFTDDSAEREESGCSQQIRQPDYAQTELDGVEESGIKERSLSAQGDGADPDGEEFVGNRGSRQRACADNR